jgi:phage protein D
MACQASASPLEINVTLNCPSCMIISSSSSSYDYRGEMQRSNRWEKLVSTVSYDVLRDVLEIPRCEAIISE